MKTYPTPSLGVLAALLLAGCHLPRAPLADQPPEPAEAKTEGLVTLSNENLQHVELRLEPAARGALETTVKAAGRVSENGNQTARVMSTLEGRVIRMNGDLNDRVRTGEVLALVQTPELLGRPLEVKAPIDGVITDRRSTPGELVTKETLLYTLSEPAELWVLAEIREGDIGAVKAGQEATFTVLAYPGESFHGKVARIGHRVEEASRTLEVRLEAANADGRLKPGMFADVEIVTAVQPEVLLLPESALQSEGDQQVVFVALDGHRFLKREVKTGRARGGQVEVLAGVEAGERIVTAGSFILKSELLKGELGEE